MVVVCSNGGRNRLDQMLVLLLLGLAFHRQTLCALSQKLCRLLCAEACEKRSRISAERNRKQILANQRNERVLIQRMKYRFLDINTKHAK